MYRPSALFRRTPEERADQLLSWNRDDTAFFAAGACHILAFAFLETYRHAGFHPVGLWPRESADPGHVYVANGAWAFDHDGWTLETELLAITHAKEPGPACQPRPIHTDLGTFCRAHHHRLRSDFAFDPWPRALRYLARFPHRTSCQTPTTGQSHCLTGLPPPVPTLERGPGRRFDAWPMQNA